MGSDSYASQEVIQIKETHDKHVSISKYLEDDF